MLTKKGEWKFDYVFDSFNDFLTEAESRGDDDKYERWGESSRTGSEMFTATPDFQSACDLGWYGWSEGMAKVEEVIATASSKSTSRAPSWDYGVAGYLPNVAAYCAGDPCHMMTKGESLAGGRPIVKVLVNAVYSASTDAQNIINRGAAIMGIIDHLESQDMRVEVMVIIPTNGNDDNYFDVTFCAKKAQEPLDKDKPIYSIGHPAILRRLFFALEETTEDLGYHGWGFGYGQCCDARNIPSDVAYLSQSSPDQCDTIEQAQAMVLAQFETILTEAQIDSIKGEWNH